VDTLRLAELLFPHITRTLADYETVYPPRALPPTAKVTRLGPSPTGFIHLGNLYGAFADERLAHQSGGRFLLRIEDTDAKREVPGAVETLLSSLAYFGVRFDEGALEEGDQGDYGPYRQRQRAELYQTAAKALVQQGLAYPCFCTEEELRAIRARQEAVKANYGYYGPWAAHRELPPEEIERRLRSGESFVIRLKSPGDPRRSFTIRDGIRGELTLPENEQDVVLLKSDGIPTYHFAHVADDHFMRVTHILRGEEWLSSLPVHVQLFQLFGWPMPVFCHTTLLLKRDNGVKRKLSKRKDPELGLNFYRQAGYHPLAVREYLLTILNSDFEEWRSAHPDAPLEAFTFRIEKMGSSGALFDLNKLNDISKNVLAHLPPSDIAVFLQDWARRCRPEIDALFRENAAYLTAMLGVGRAGQNPRKDLICGEQIFTFLRFFFDDYFAQEDPPPEQIVPEEAKGLLEAYLAGYDPREDNAAWFARVRRLAADYGYAAKPKDYQQHPERYRGHVGDISGLLRVALTGRRNAPDLWEIQQVMGEERVRRRITAFRDAL
jgi:glutamyl-tRNA synthetase